MAWQPRQIEALPPDFKVPRDRMDKMRWLLVWKPDESRPSGKKAKARIILLGFMDPDLTEQATRSPTMTRTTYAANMARYTLCTSPSGSASAIQSAPFVIAKSSVHMVLDRDP